MSFCVICGGEPDEAHHLTPQHLGGAKDSPTVFLCGSHHAAVHRVATRIFKGKSIEPKDDGLWLKNIGAIAIINKIVQAMLNAENLDLSRLPARLILKIPRGKLRRIHRRKKDLGFSSLEAYILSVVDRDLPP